jgi:hypothetical protein
MLEQRQDYDFKKVASFNRLKRINLFFLDLSELAPIPGVTFSFPNGADQIMNFEVSVKPEDGMYQGIST